MEETLDSLFKDLYEQESSLEEHLIEIKILNLLDELTDLNELRKYLKKLNDFNIKKNYKDGD